MTYKTEKEAERQRVIQSIKLAKHYIGILEELKPTVDSKKRIAIFTSIALWEEEILRIERRCMIDGIEITEEDLR
jgi:hypothetical protein